MKDRRSRIEHALQELAKHPGVLGAALVSRDGICLQSVGKQELRRETFCAMSATLMGAAEIALAEVDPSRAMHVVAETQTTKIVVLGATPDLLLVAEARVDADLASMLDRTRATAATIASAAGEG
jgi:predicted regulator of Ras-like GTPase activity (Roadblock/LC7/MglB family)